MGDTVASPLPLRRHRPCCHPSLLPWQVIKFEGFLHFLWRLLLVALTMRVRALSLRNVVTLSHWPLDSDICLEVAKKDILSPLSSISKHFKTVKILLTAIC